MNCVRIPDIHESSGTRSTNAVTTEVDDRLSNALMYTSGHSIQATNDRMHATFQESNTQVTSKSAFVATIKARPQNPF